MSGPVKAAVRHRRAAKVPADELRHVGDFGDRELSLRLLFEAQYVAKVDRRGVFDQPGEAAPRAGGAASRFLQPLPDFFPLKAPFFWSATRSVLGTSRQ